MTVTIALDTKLAKSDLLECSSPKIPAGMPITSQSIPSFQFNTIIFSLIINSFKDSLSQLKRKKIYSKIMSKRGRDDALPEERTKKKETVDTENKHNDIQIINCNR